MRSHHERDLNGRVADALHHQDPVRVENSVGPGTPDLNYNGGWIEDKYLPGWPKRASTPVRVRHFVREQRGWIMKRCASGGRVHVVIQVGAEVFVFDGRAAAQFLGSWTRGQMYDNAALVMNPWNGLRLREFISQCDKDRMGSCR